jgi:hypothetical protein
LLKIRHNWVACGPQLAENYLQGLYRRPVPRDVANAFSFGDFVSASQSWPGNEPGILQENARIRTVEYSLKTIYFRLDRVAQFILQNTYKYS